MITQLRDEYLAIAKVLSQKNYINLSQSDFVLQVQHYSPNSNLKKLNEIWYDLMREIGKSAWQW